MMLDMAKRVMNTIGSVYRMYLDDGRRSIFNMWR